VWYLCAPCNYRSKAPLPPYDIHQLIAHLKDTLGGEEGNDGEHLLCAAQLLGSQQAARQPALKSVIPLAFDTSKTK
jgi:hypothetical protein